VQRLGSLETAPELCFTTAGRADFPRLRAAGVVSGGTIRRLRTAVPTVRHEVAIRIAGGEFVVQSDVVSEVL
jgi:hypothetical protein